MFVDLPLVPGQIVQATISAAEPYDLFAKVTGVPEGRLKLANDLAATPGS